MSSRSGPPGHLARILENCSHHEAKLLEKHGSASRRTPVSPKYSTSPAPNTWTIRCLLPPCWHLSNLLRPVMQLSTQRPAHQALIYPPGEAETLCWVSLRSATLTSMVDVLSLVRRDGPLLETLLEMASSLSDSNECQLLSKPLPAKAQKEAQPASRPNLYASWPDLNLQSFKSIDRPRLLWPIHTLNEDNTSSWPLGHLQFFVRIVQQLNHHEEGEDHSHENGTPLLRASKRTRGALIPFHPFHFGVTLPAST